MPKPSEKTFLVLVDAAEKHFLHRIDGQTVHTVGVPSVAPQFDYETADKLARLLQQRRHRFACVADALGRPVTGDMLDVEPSGDKSDLPKTLKQLDKIPVSEQRRRYKSDPAFSQRVNELWKS